MCTFMALACTDPPRRPGTLPLPHAYLEFLCEDGLLALFRNTEVPSVDAEPVHTSFMAQSALLLATFTAVYGLGKGVSWSMASTTGMQFVRWTVTWYRHVSMVYAMRFPCVRVSSVGFLIR